MQLYLPTKFNTNLLVANSVDPYYILLIFLRQQYLINQSLTSKIAILNCDMGFWRARHKAAIKREEKLKKEKEHLQALLKLRDQQLFAKKTEKNSKSSKKEGQQQKTINPRGQQKGAKSHGRINNNHLPCEHETIDIEDENLKTCPCCGLPYKEFGTEDSEVLTIVDVKAYKRIIQRKKYLKCCGCVGYPEIITAPSIPKLIPKGKLDISIWVKILHEKYKYQIPIYRLLVSAPNFRVIESY